MAEAVHEVAHGATHDAAHSGTGSAKMIGLLISVLALFLAVSEMLGKSSQTKAMALNIEASDTWNFYQAKTVRQTAVRTVLEASKLGPNAAAPEAQNQFRTWQATIDRWESEPDKNEGRKELMAKAQRIEHNRDEALEKYHAYEVASLILQLGIVLASVSLLSSIRMFAYGSAALGVVGVLFLLGAYVGFGPILHLLH